MLRENKWHFVYHAIVWLETGAEQSVVILNRNCICYKFLFSLHLLSNNFMISFATSIQLIRTVFVQMNLFVLKMRLHFNVWMVCFHYVPDRKFSAEWKTIINFFFRSSFIPFLSIYLTFDFEQWNQKMNRCFRKKKCGGAFEFNLHFVFFLFAFFHFLCFSYQCSITSQNVQCSMYRTMHLNVVRILFE